MHATPPPTISTSTITANSRLSNEHILQHLRRRICTLQLAPGLRLSEVKLAQDYSVSRTPIRWVLNRLEMEGLVNTRHGAGSDVTDVNWQALRSIYHLRIDLYDTVIRLNQHSISAKNTAWLQTFESQVKSSQWSNQSLSEAIMDLFEFSNTLIDDPYLAQFCSQLYFNTTRFWWLLHLSKDALDKEQLSLEAEVTQLIEALRLGQIDVYFAIRKSYLVANYCKLKQLYQVHWGLDQTTDPTNLMELLDA
jgi:DNA-binding GntR family transcriptional regulator|tara:strand:+ start:411 stop:1160 length:750 start_codon:yes stop_codon:yes gene_type:complete